MIICSVIVINTRRSSNDPTFGLLCLLFLLRSDPLGSRSPGLLSCCFHFASFVCAESKCESSNSSEANGTRETSDHRCLAVAVVVGSSLHLPLDVCTCFFANEAEQIFRSAFLRILVRFFSFSLCVCVAGLFALPLARTVRSANVLIDASVGAELIE